MKRLGWAVCAVVMVGGVMYPGGGMVRAEPRTEAICSFGMVKGEQSRSCEMPVPPGCRVAKFPGYDMPWTDISRGGKTICAIDGDRTDWDTAIVGSCSACGTDNCSARFSVMLACEDSVPTVQPRKTYEE